MLAQKIAAGILFALLLAVRVTFQRRALTDAGPVREFEGRINIALRIFAALLLFGTLGAWFAGAAWLQRFQLSMPAWLNWLGAPVGFAGIAGLIDVHRALGRNFSGTLHLRDDHELIVSGPYRYVRHPMYTAFYLILTGFALLTENWLLGGGMILGLTFVMLSRVKHEEQVMLERFGGRYAEYMSRTGRFLPRGEPPISAPSRRSDS